MPQQRERLKKPSAAKSRSAEPAQTEPVNADSSNKLIETDKLLADIDEVLDEMLGEETARQFVDAYRQKGGE